MMRFPKFSKRWRFEKYSPTQPRNPAGTPTGGQWTGGTGISTTQAQEAEQRLRQRLADIENEPNRNMTGRQYMGTVGEFAPEMPEELRGKNVFYDPQLTDSAAYTDGNSVVLGPGAFEGRGTSRSLGDTFAHEMEHLDDQVRYGARNELSPRRRQMLREVDETAAMAFAGAHGREHAAAYLDNYFGPERGYTLSHDEREQLIDDLVQTGTRRRR